MPAVQREGVLDIVPSIRAAVAARDGIHLFHIRYWSDALRGDVGRALDPLAVKYDPRDMSRVFVRRMNGRWIEARYRDLRRPAISLWEYREALRQLPSPGKREVNEAIIFETIAHQREIVLKARHDRASARLGHARQPRSAPPRPEPEMPLASIVVLARRRARALFRARG